MNIVSAEYLSSFLKLQDVNLDDLPTIAFIGRSNVGKSSLINHLVNRKKLVKTSSTPGKTQLINYFLINNGFYFVDLPGYGFAQVPVNVKTKWLSMITEFLVNNRNIRLVVHLVDSRHKPTGEDVKFKNLLAENAVPHVVIANKSDKLKSSQRQKQKTMLMKILDLDTEPIFHSAVKRTGSQEIWSILAEYLQD